MTYAEKLKDPRWQKKRLLVMKHAQFRCQMCGDRKRTQHVHHSYYTKEKEPWQYPTGSLICVCEKCHGILHPPKPEQRPWVPPPEEIDDSPKMNDDDVSTQFAELRRILGAPKK